MRNIACFSKDQQTDSKTMAETHQEESAKPKMSKERLRKATRIFEYVLPYKWQFFAGLIVLTLGSLIFLGIMRIPGELFNAINQEAGEEGFSINQLFIAVVVLLIAQGVFSYLRVQLFTIVSEKSMALLRTQLYEKLIALSIPFYEKTRVGELTSRITNDVAQVQQVVSVTLAEFVRQLIILVGGISIIVFTMPRLALIILLTFPLVVVAAMYFGRFIRNLMKERQDLLAETNVVVEETMQNIHTVKAYTNEWFEINRYSSKLTEAVAIALKAGRMRGLFAAFIIVIMFGALFFIMWRAALMVQSGQLEEGDLVNFVVFTGIIGAAIASIGNFYTTIVASIGATERIFEIMDTPSEVNVQKENNSLALNGAIEYKNVHFSYPTRPDIKVLKGINMRIAPGSKVALVGSSGSGKSTIVALLQRFYDISSGHVSIAGKDIKELPLSAYRNNIAIVPQEVLLFGGSIRENILYGNPEASNEQIEDAAQKANTLEFINSFPEGLDTIVGERGVKLSGGQRQRIAIARAILKDPDILLLDEATSSLDTESERLVQSALNNLMEGRTSIIIAHRLSTIRDVDCIYVINKGQIVEQGTHQELEAIENGIYKKLSKLQHSDKDIDELFEL